MCCPPVFAQFTILCLALSLHLELQPSVFKSIIIAFIQVLPQPWCLHLLDYVLINSIESVARPVETSHNWVANVGMGAIKLTVIRRWKLGCIAGVKTSGSM